MFMPTYDFMASYSDTKKNELSSGSESVPFNLYEVYIYYSLVVALRMTTCSM